MRYEVRGPSYRAPKKSPLTLTFPRSEKKRRETRHGRAVAPIDSPFGTIVHPGSGPHILGAGRGTPSGLCVVGPRRVKMGPKTGVRPFAPMPRVGFWR